MYKNSTSYRKGQCGNPSGRPKGSRNKLTQKFLIDVEKDWKKYGKDVLESVRTSNPSVYFKIVSSLIVKDAPEINQDEGHVTVEDARAELLRRLQQRFPIAEDGDGVENDIIG